MELGIGSCFIPLWNALQHHYVSFQPPWNFIHDTCDSKLMQEYSAQKIFPFPMSSISKRQCMLPLWGSHISLGEWFRTKSISPCNQPLPIEIGGIWGKLLINPLLTYLGLKCLSRPQCFSHWGKQRKDCRKKKYFPLPVCSGWCLAHLTLSQMRNVYWDLYLWELQTQAMTVLRERLLLSQIAL